MVKIIVAVSENNIIGKDDKLPWHIKEELAFFKKTTLGHTLLFGRKTYASLPGKLKDRKIFVLGRQEIDGVDGQFFSIDECKSFISKYKNSDETLFICGGKSVYEQLQDLADEVLLTVIKGQYDGDTSLNLDLSRFKKEIILENPKFTVYKYF